MNYLSFAHMHMQTEIAESLYVCFMATSSSKELHQKDAIA